MMTSTTRREMGATLNRDDTKLTRKSFIAGGIGSAGAERSSPGETGWHGPDPTRRNES
jgi:hypothetical protein